jgi:hypothetical protein
MNLVNLICQIHPSLLWYSGFGSEATKGKTTLPIYYQSGLFKQTDSLGSVKQFTIPLQSVKSTVVNRASPSQGANCMLAYLAGDYKSLKYDYQFYTDVDRHPSTTAG